MDEFDYIELLNSARSVLRGVAPVGTLSRVADVKAGRWLAAQFMHRDASTVLSTRWQRMLRVALAGTAGNGVPWHAQAKAANDLIADDFEPACLYSWRRPRDESDEVARMRRQALRNFPAPMFQAIWTAHSDEPAWRVHAAWEVLDAVDGGRKIVAPLARFLRVSRKAIKVSAKYSLFAHNTWTQYGRTRRSLRVVQAMRERDPEIFISPDAFPFIDVVMRSARVGIDLAYMGVSRDCEEHGARHCRICVSRAALSGLIRHLCTRAGAPAIARVLEKLPCGWTACSLESGKKLRNEGMAMGHCVASYLPRVALGEAQVFALCSSDGGERATVVIEPPLGIADGDEFIEVKIAGPGNEPFHALALVALGELLQRHGSPRLYISFI